MPEHLNSPCSNLNVNEEYEGEIAEFLQAVNKKDFERVICKPDKMFTINIVI